MSILVIAEHADGALVPAVLNTVTAAGEIASAAGSDVHLLVAGADCAGVAEAAAGIAGVAKVLHAEDARFGHALAEPMAELVAALGKDYSHVLAAATKSGKNILPRAAALLEVSPITEITAVIGENGSGKSTLIKMLQ